MVFLSHSWKDKQFTARLATRLRKKYGIEVWHDREQTLAGDALTPTIKDALKRSTSFVIIITPDSMNSKWVREELKIALRRQAKDPEYTIIPIILKKSKVHTSIAKFIHVDWSQRHAYDILVKSIKKIKLVPNFTTDSPPNSFGLKNVKYRVQIVGGRKQRAFFTETFSAIAATALTRIDRYIHSDGIIKEVRAIGMTLERVKNESYAENWTLSPLRPISPNESFSYTIKYQIDNCFSVGKSDDWKYTIESPTELITVEFEFVKCDVSEFEVIHQVGQTLSPEPMKVRLVKNKFFWRKVAPTYKDTYKFKFTLKR